MQNKKAQLILEIKRISNSLDIQYSKEFNFRNHCYLRISYDATVDDKWDNKIKKPFTKFANELQLQIVIDLLNLYSLDKEKLLADNKKSLHYRNNYKIVEKQFAPQLF